MYLTKIDKVSGLLYIDDLNDGILGIKDFKNLIDAKGFGLECMTCVALSIDHLSPIRFYAYKERHIRAMKITTGKSNFYNWNEDLIQKACVTYEMLQFNEDLRELELIRNSRLLKLNEIETETDETKKSVLFNDLKKLRILQKEFEGSTDLGAIFEAAPSKNGYVLSRLEEKLLNQKSFYHE